MHHHDCCGRSDLRSAQVRSREDRPSLAGSTCRIEGMSITKYPMTVQGARALEDELAHLTKVERPRLSQAIGEARELGDLKENAEYHAAREEQGMVEAR
ncbi:Transcription elongation factor GreA, partial [Pseudomonas savastanoi pv. glycinea]